MCVCSVTQLCPTLFDLMDYSLPGSSVHGIFRARILESVAITYSRGCSQLRDQIAVSCISCIRRRVLYHCAPPEAQVLIYVQLTYSTALSPLFSTLSISLIHSYSFITFFVRNISYLVIQFKFYDPSSQQHS